MGFERQITLMIGCLETLFYGGTIFGWPSLVFVLKDIGYFGKDCLQTGDDVTTPASSSSASPRPPNEDHGSIDDDDAYFTNSSSLVACPTQDASLQLMYSVAIACQLFSFFPMGVLFDILGTRFTRLLFSVLLLAGNLLMGFSSPELPGLLYPGTILMVAGGTAVIISSMEIGNLFPSHKSTVITGLQGLYGSSQVVFFILKIAYEAGFSLYTAFFISAGCTLLLNINTFIFLPVNHIPWPLPQDYKLTIQCFSSPHKAPPPTASEMYNEAYVVDGGTAEEESQSDILKGDLQTTKVGENKPTTTENKNDSSNGQAPSPSSTAPDPPQWAKYTSLRSCILSFPFWAILLWQAILELDATFTLGVLNYFLTRLAKGDTAVVSSYTNGFIIIQLTAILLGPLGGLVVERNRAGPCKKGNNTRSYYDDILDCCLPLALPSLLSAAYSGIFLIPNLEVQYLAFMIFTFFRVFFFGTGPVIIASIFPQKYFGRIYGVIRTITGCVTLLQYPIFILIQEYLDDDPFYVMIGFAVADLLTLFSPVFLYITTKNKMNNTDQNQTQQ
ncbi:solute carrier family 43 member 3 isoform X1 [Strongylocentrotus purpuratus]|uniref:Solute carrier family 43 member 3 n=1 Tax=Strongylocentrotus purpuratus TaxID=7668 RepID=A0A7M7N8A8_STRPU|nr:solute carrier family 43 member 3 isoform X1 [Strongylocentrotus purpuratus]XP_030832756.1 solute carrier family 43 member 3 isoform X1 [Strongylocentrotus purpuratus]